MKLRIDIVVRNLTPARCNGIGTFVYRLAELTADTVYLGSPGGMVHSPCHLREKGLCGGLPRGRTLVDTVAPSCA